MASNKLWGIVLVVIVCSGCTNAGVFTYLAFLDQNPNESTISRIARKGVIRLGTSPDYPPFESIANTAEGLEVVGFDIELAKLVVANISSQIGKPIRLEVEAAFFNALMAGLQSNAYDMVIAAFAIRPERELEVDFSIPYYFSLQCCLVQASDTSIHDQLDLVNRTVATQIGTTGDDLANGLNCIEKSFPTVEMIMLDLINGDSDAAIIDVPVAEHFALGGDVKIAFNFTSIQFEGFGIAMREGEGSSPIMGIINNTIATLNATGQLQELFRGD
nr:transporter substrate-binding domain-containing protein [Candidatus Sigynarchaeota archaeon]